MKGFMIAIWKVAIKDFASTVFAIAIWKAHSLGVFLPLLFGKQTVWECSAVFAIAIWKADTV
jgi:hypothetical protein